MRTRQGGFKAPLGRGVTRSQTPQKHQILPKGPETDTPKGSKKGPFWPTFSSPARVHAGLWIRVHTCGTHGWSTHPMCELVGSGSFWGVRRLTKVSDFSPPEIPAP